MNQDSKQLQTNHDESSGCGRRFYFGCGSLVILTILLAVAALLYAFTQERQAAQYPGSQMISEHNNYSGFPLHYSWENSYRTDDSFNNVYNWYSITFDMGAEARALGSCIYLEDTLQRLGVQRSMAVHICGTENGQLIYVSRSTAVRR